MILDDIARSFLFMNMRPSSTYRRHTSKKLEDYWLVWVISVNKHQVVVNRPHTSIDNNSKFKKCACDLLLANPCS